MIDDDTGCSYCGEEICIFLQFEADIVSLRGWNKRAALLETNRERRKHTFRTHFRWSKGIGGGREQLEQCVVIGVRSWYPDSAYMGFHEAEDRSVRRQAEDMYGKKISVWWEFRNGVWVLAED